MVRIKKHSNNANDKLLIKGMSGIIKDLAFAYINAQIILAVIDSYGFLYVYEIKETEEKMV